MTDGFQRKTGIKVLAGSYLWVLAVGAWRTLRGKAPRVPPPVQAELSALAALPEGAQRGDTPPTGPHLQDLSNSTPGAAPLDRLAEAFREEKREEQEGVDPIAKVPPFDRDAVDMEPTKEAIAEVLAYQSLHSKHLAGWHRPNPSELPLPTYGPVVMAFGIVIFAMGLATTWYVCVVGSIVFAVAAWRWAGELQGE